jgi:Protein of unknown function (DUF4242)
MIYAAKCYWPGVTSGDVAGAAERVTRATEDPGGQGAHVYLGSLLFPDDELVLCMFDAPSPVAVRRASDRAGLPCERVMGAVWLAGAFAGGRRHSNEGRET